MESLFDDAEDDVAGPSDVSSSFEITHQSLPIFSLSSNGNLCKIVPEDDPLKAYYVLARYDGTDLSLCASDGEKAWSGVLSKNTLKELSAATHLKEADHLQDTLTALQQGGGDCAAFVYAVSATSSGSLQLVWKKFLPEENIRFQLGSVVLHPTPSPKQTHSQLFDFAIDSMQTLRAEVSAVTAEKQRLITERASALQRLEESVSLKEELERDLYGKFKVVLNDKKAKIRMLDQQVEQLLDESAQQQKLLEAGAGRGNEPGGTASNRVTATGESRSGSGSETDEEVGMPTMEVDAPGPSTSSTEHAAASSLLDGEEEGESLPVKRRRRKEASRTGQPLVIPKPPPARRKPVPSKQDSSSSSSSSSKRASVESDELLNML